jgi:hypothetical protein
MYKTPFKMTLSGRLPRVIWIKYEDATRQTKVNNDHGLGRCRVDWTDSDFIESRIHKAAWRFPQRYPIMGNSSSSGRGHHDESVDYGSLVPQGIYTGPRDWNQAIVSQLIVGRKLAPFYRPLEEYEDSWDDDQILAARKELPDLESADSVTRIEAAAAHPSSHRSKRPGSLKEPARPEAQVYRGAVECPICFLVGQFLLTLFPLRQPDYVLFVPSTIHPISTTLDAVTRQSAQSALYRSSVQNRQPLT